VRDCSSSSRQNFRRLYYLYILRFITFKTSDYYYYDSIDIEKKPYGNIALGVKIILNIMRDPSIVSYIRI